MDSTISAIACAHRETFLYAHDKLTSPQALQQQQQQQPNNHGNHKNGEAELWGPNRCPNGYQANGLNTIYHHNNNLGTGSYLLPEGNGMRHHHSNGRRSLFNNNFIGGDGQKCPMKNHTGIVLVRTGLCGVFAEL